MIILDHATTGDGTLTGLLPATRVARTGRPLRELAAVMEWPPQVLISARRGQVAGVDVAVPATAVRQRMADARTRHHAWVREHGTDLPEVAEWSWNA